MGAIVGDQEGFFDVGKTVGVSLEGLGERDTGTNVGDNDGNRDVGSSLGDPVFRVVGTVVGC